MITKLHDPHRGRIGNRGLIHPDGPGLPAHTTSEEPQVKQLGLTTGPTGKIRPNTGLGATRGH